LYISSTGSYGLSLLMF